MSKIKIAIAGIGNCASTIIQGIHYYKGKKQEDSVGLMHYDLAGYKPSDIEVVAAFDIDKRKVGKDLSEAILEKPNNTTIFQKDIPKSGVIVKKSPVLDGYSPHMNEYSEDHTFVVSEKEEVIVAEELKKSGAEILVNYLPVGSEKASRYMAEQCLEAGTAFINGMPVFIASEQEWQKKFEEKKLPIVGDDVKSAFGATIVHRALAKLFIDRGLKLDRTYQINVGGNTDFLNMLNAERLKSKKISKTQSVQSQLPLPLDAENIHISPSDYVPWLKDRKLAFIRLEGKLFGDVPLDIEVRLNCEDSPNSAGSMIDAIRCCKLALDRNISGCLTSISAYTMKHPAQQFADSEARKMVEEFIAGKRER
jgi:myo-inositol-1-phosphate synthase